jgi:uncharacterized integral membrane protein
MIKRISTIAAWGAAALVAALAALNWTTLMAPAPLDLVVVQIKAPLGVVLLGVAVVLAALFFLASLRTEIGSLMECRRLHREIQRLQGLADMAEATRVGDLQMLVSTQFRLLNERLDTAALPAERRPNESAPAKAIAA